MAKTKNCDKQQLLTYIFMSLQSKQNADLIPSCCFNVHTCITKLVYYFHSIWFSSDLVDAFSYHTGNSSIGN